MNNVEICIDSDNEIELSKNIEKVYRAGAKRIELCSEMSEDGLTPSVESIQVARQAFKRSGLMVMIRPRSGNFCYNTQEIDQMVEQVKCAAELGADGVVFGVLAEKGKSFNVAAMQKLILLSKTFGLEVGIHRAFDAVIDKKSALLQLIGLSVDRVLTSGSQWGAASDAISGMENLKSFASVAGNEIELVIAGGVSPENANTILTGFSEMKVHVSLHAYSSVLHDGVISHERVKALVNTTPEHKIVTR
ncbi:copper homeostasis protein CutC [Thalassotalea hakodatensis]|uniref:copper homeostasis protein CutC n=1 Tax=Thalassotalea hakodatensis TaxID=3030492 RepID=UPI0025735634|nr:copper homeostasis protein CutC [Thalassotalea hakodatensis]